MSGLLFLRRVDRSDGRAGRVGKDLFGSISFMQTDGMASYVMPFLPILLLWIPNRTIQPDFGRVVDMAVR